MIDRTAVVAAYCAGAKIEAIAAEHGCSESYVLKIARRDNLPRRGRGQRQNSGRDADIVAAYRAGFSAGDIGRQRNMSRNAVYYVLEKAGCARRETGVRSRRIMLPADLGLPL